MLGRLTIMLLQRMLTAAASVALQQIFNGVQYCSVADNLERLQKPSFV